MAARGQLQKQHTWTTGGRHNLQSTNTEGETQTAEADGCKGRHNDPTEGIPMANRPEKTTADQKRKTRHQPRTTTERKRGTKRATESSPTKRQPTTQEHHAAKTTDDGNLQGHELQGQTPRRT